MLAYIQMAGYSHTSVESRGWLGVGTVFKWLIKKPSRTLSIQKGNSVSAHDQIWKALATVKDPKTDRDVVSAGFINDLKLEGGTVSFVVSLSPDRAGFREQFQNIFESLLTSISGVDKVAIDFETMQQVRKLQVPNSGLTRVKKIIAVSSCKGGVGKSTVAAALAMEFAEREYQVGLLDVDIYGPSVPTLFHLENERIKVREDNWILPSTVGKLKIVSFGFWMGDQPAVLRGPIVTNYLNQFLHFVDWGDLDFCFIDMPPGTGDIQLTISQTLSLDGAVIVTTPQSLSLIDASKGIHMFNQVRVPVLGIIENMSYFICSHCQEKHYVFGGKEGYTLSERFGLNELAKLPLNSEQFGRDFSSYRPQDDIRQAADAILKAIAVGSHEKDVQPEFAFDEKKLSVTWSDGEKSQVDHYRLRLSCRCARCINEMTGEKMASAESIPLDVHPKEIFPIGNYALGINWSDGHTSGIYSYQTIHEVAAKIN
jgi:Mrp family chromosome partitioning ATPase/DUF971 family protein